MQSRVEYKHLQSQTLATCPLQLSPVTAGVGAPSHYVFSVSYNILLNNEHLSQFKCCLNLNVLKLMFAMKVEG